MNKKIHKTKFRISLNINRINNYLKGYSFSSIQICRVCGHTAYSPNHPDHGIRGN